MPGKFSGTAPPALGTVTSTARREKKVSPGWSASGGLLLWPQLRRGESADWAIRQRHDLPVILKHEVILLPELRYQPHGRKQRGVNERVWGDDALHPAPVMPQHQFRHPFPPDGPDIAALSYAIERGLDVPLCHFFTSIHPP